MLRCESCHLDPTPHGACAALSLAEPELFDKLIKNGVLPVRVLGSERHLCAAFVMCIGKACRGRIRDRCSCELLMPHLSTPVLNI